MLVAGFNIFTPKSPISLDSIKSKISRCYQAQNGSLKLYNSSLASNFSLTLLEANIPCLIYAKEQIDLDGSVGAVESAPVQSSFSKDIISCKTDDFFVNFDEYLNFVGDFDLDNFSDIVLLTKELDEFHTINKLSFVFDNVNDELFLKIVSDDPNAVSYTPIYLNSDSSNIISFSVREFAGECFSDKGTLIFVRDFDFLRVSYSPNSISIISS